MNSRGSCFMNANAAQACTHRYWYSRQKLHEQLRSERLRPDVNQILILGRAVKRTISNDARLQYTQCRLPRSRCLDSVRARWPQKGFQLPCIEDVQRRGTRLGDKIVLTVSDTFEGARNFFIYQPHSVHLQMCCGSNVPGFYIYIRYTLFHIRI